MSRSLKKGPYINVKLEKKVLAMNESGKKSVVILLGIQLQFITEINLFLFMLQKTWWDISWANLLRHVRSVAMQVTRKNN